MILWRTSRLVLLFFILQLAIVGIVAATIVYRGGPISWDGTLALLRSRTNTATSPTPIVPDGVGHPVELPQYPVVEIRTPDVSIFDPAA